ncbi:hypothetical protein TNCV_1491691, partial [Trichonephila clavipes]
KTTGITDEPRTSWLVWPKKQREHYCPIRDVGLYKHHGRAAALLAININELSSTIDYMFFLCAFDLKEGGVMGGRRSPKLQLQFLHLPCSCCLQETEFGGMRLSYPTSEGEP